MALSYRPKHLPNILATVDGLRFSNLDKLEKFNGRIFY